MNSILNYSVLNYWIWAFTPRTELQLWNLTLKISLPSNLFISVIFACCGFYDWQLESGLERSKFSSTFNHGSSLSDFEPITLSSYLLHKMAVGRKMKGVPHMSLWILKEQTRYKQINKTLINHFQRKSKKKRIDNYYFIYYKLVYFKEQKNNSFLIC